MSSTAAFGEAVNHADERLVAFFEELAELTGQRNAVDGRIVEIVAEIDRDALWALTGARSIEALVAWKTGVTPSRAGAIAAVAHRLAEFPLCAAALKQGRLSLDQVGVIAERAAPGTDERYATLAESATVTQLRTALRIDAQPDPDADPDPDEGDSGEGDPDEDGEPAPVPGPRPSISSRSDADYTHWHIALPHPEAAAFAAALHAHRDTLTEQWKHDHPSPDGAGVGAPMPDTVDAFLRLVESSWDAEATRRPHGSRTTVVLHLDVTDRLAALHLGPVLSDADRRYLSCDATCEVWFDRAGTTIGAGRATRTVNRRLRRVLEHRDRCCRVPGCGATRALHAHHIIHWDDGGPTDLDNLVLLCPYHHRLHHRGGITITGPADRLTVTDHRGRALQPGSLARPPTTPPPTVPPCPGPTGQRAQWKWYPAYQPPPPNNN